MQRRQQYLKSLSRSMRDVFGSKNSSKGAHQHKQDKIKSNNENQSLEDSSDDSSESAASSHDNAKDIMNSQ
jgi:hypothetical protein